VIRHYATEGDGSLIRELTGHASSISALASTASGSHVVSAGADKSFRVWSLSEETTVLAISAHTAQLYSVALSPNDLTLATAAADGLVKLWDIAGYINHDSAYHLPPPPSHIVPSEEANSMIAARGKLPRFTSRRVGTPSTSPLPSTQGTVHREFTAHQRGEVSDVDESVRVDGRSLRFGDIWDDPQLFKTPSPSTIKLAGEVTKVFPHIRQMGGLTSIAATPDQTRVVMAAVDGSWVIRESLRGMAISPRRVAHVGKICSVVWLSPGKTIVTAGADNGCKIWDCATGRMMRDFDGHTATVTGVSIASSRHLFTSSLDGTSKYWDIATGRSVHSWPDAVAANVVRCLDENVALVGRKDGQLRVIDTRQPQLAPRFLGHTADVHDVDVLGDLCVTASADGTALMRDLRGGIIDSLGGKGLPSLHRGGVVAAKFIPNGKHVVTACTDAFLRIFSTRHVPGGDRAGSGGYNIEQEWLCRSACSALAAPQTHSTQDGPYLFAGDVAGWSYFLADGRTWRPPNY